MAEIDVDIEEITRTVWGTLFEAPLQTEDPEDRSALERGTTVTSCVQIRGAWGGGVVVQCPWDLAHRLTSQIFGDASTPGPDDVRDVLGELANVIGGNIKALLPAPSTISQPTVAMGSDYELSVVGTIPVSTVSFRCDGHPLQVTLLALVDEAISTDPATP